MQAVNTFGVTGLLSRHTASGNVSTFYAFDERGNVAQRTGGTGAVTGSDLYDGYGARQGTAATQPDPFGYGGQVGYYTDAETGLILCTHRFYDPQAGRFVTRDPIGYAGGVNLYGYTGNNPINESDADGTQVAIPAPVVGVGVLAAIIWYLTHNGYHPGPIHWPPIMTPPVSAPPIQTYPRSPPNPAPLTQVRGANKLKPNPKATGGHCTWRRGPGGRINHWVDWKPNAQNPSGYDEDQRFDLDGASHGGVPPPHVHSPGASKPRTADPIDIPK